MSTFIVSIVRSRVLSSTGVSPTTRSTAGSFTGLIDTLSAVDVSSLFIESVNLSPSLAFSGIATFIV